MSGKEKTEDGLSVLHLAASEGHLEIVKLLVDVHKVDVNVLHGTYGTPLHCAAYAGHLEVVEYLLKKGRSDLETETSLKAIDISRCSKIETLILKHVNSAERKDTLGKLYKDMQIPAMPPKVKGAVYKVRTDTEEIVKRYFALDLAEHVLVMYDDKSDYPYRPKRKYPLIQISHVKGIDELMKDKKYFSFEFYYGKRNVLCCENRMTAAIWIDYLNSAVEYANFIKQVRKKMLKAGKDDMEELLKIVDTEPQTELELEDNIKEENESSFYRGSKSTQDSLEEGKDLLECVEKVNLNSFKILEKVGQGAFGSIFKVRHNDTGVVYAMKVISKTFLFKTKQLKYAISESQVLKAVNHPFIIKLHFSFQDSRFLYFVLDYCCFGDLSMQIFRKQIFSENEARFYIAELILAVEYLHSLNFVYRDLKPDNILLGEDGHIKLSDFGLAKQISQKAKYTDKSFCGSLSYLSPEMLLKKSSDKTVDVYGIGTILYELLTGAPPHYNESPKIIIKNIKYSPLKIPVNLSARAKSALKVPLSLTHSCS
eukprot:TRINITY_DN2360_c0_g3_i2.p1 TRINITY_DN2360_c0_g3~~TRINITY_DN2360_c0_g3_i2.p1  ORF type:complete len:539 (-),score=158.89 TRINITY_DN2360_c0_g3_i2:393-2009(-)